MTYFPQIDPISWDLEMHFSEDLCYDETMMPDHQGYPLLPNGDGEWSFSPTTVDDNCNKMYGEWAWKTIKVYGDKNSSRCAIKQCQGLLVCKGVKGDQPCGATARPQVKHNPEYVENLVCANCHQKAFEWIQCAAKIRFDYKGSHQFI